MSKGRFILSAAMIRPDVLAAMEGFHSDVVREVAEAVAKEPVVVVGMSGNPFVKKACRALQESSIAYKFLSYGGYMSQWRRRLAVKLWSGWPTFPQVFVQGVLIGGYDELAALIQSGELKSMLNETQG